MNAFYTLPLRGALFPRTGADSELVASTSPAQFRVRVVRIVATPQCFIVPRGWYFGCYWRKKRNPRPIPSRAVLLEMFVGENPNQLACRDGVDLDALASPAAFDARLCLPYLLSGQTFRLRLRGHGAYHIMAIVQDARDAGIGESVCGGMGRDASHMYPWGGGS